jgi:hypothetical protein
MQVDAIVAVCVRFSRENVGVAAGGFITNEVQPFTHVGVSRPVVERNADRNLRAARKYWDCFDV